MEENLFIMPQPFSCLLLLLCTIRTKVKGQISMLGDIFLPIYTY